METIILVVLYSSSGFILQGDLEKAISFYRSSLAIDANFEPARNRLQAILCTLLFDDSGSLRDTKDVMEN